MGEQQEQNQSDFVLKLRRAALRSAQNLHEQQQQREEEGQQQQEEEEEEEGNDGHDAVPRMCGVMDWLVCLFNLGLT